MKSKFEDKNYLCDMLKLMSIEEDAEINTNTNALPTYNNENDITRDRSLLSPDKKKSLTEKKRKTHT